MTIKPATMMAMGEVFPDCPPPWARGLCETPEHFHHFVQWKQFYTDLNHLLTCYFAGEAPPEYFDSKYRDWLMLEMFKLLRMYDLLFVGWEFLPFGSDLSLAHIFKCLIQSESLHAFVQCTAKWKEFSPRGNQKDIKFLNDCIKEIDLSMADTLGAIRLSRYKSYHAKKSVQRVWEDLLALERNCLNTLRAVKNPPTSLKNALKAFDAALEDIEAWGRKEHHPRNAHKGHRIIKGKRTDM